LLLLLLQLKLLPIVSADVAVVAVVTLLVDEESEWSSTIIFPSFFSLLEGGF